MVVEDLSEGASEAIQDLRNCESNERYLDSDADLKISSERFHHLFEVGYTSEHCLTTNSWMLWETAPSFEVMNKCWVDLHCFSPDYLSDRTIVILQHHREAVAPLGPHEHNIVSGYCCTDVEPVGLVVDHIKRLKDANIIVVFQAMLNYSDLRNSRFLEALDEDVPSNDRISCCNGLRSWKLGENHSIRPEVVDNVSFFDDGNENLRKSRHN